MDLVTGLQVNEASAFEVATNMPDSSQLTVFKGRMKMSQE